MKVGHLSTLAAVVLGACAAPVAVPPPLSPETAASAFSARSLRDPQLHRFLADEMGRDPGERWDFEALSWAAFYFHPSLELARAQWASARAAEQLAGQRPNPTLTLTPGYNSTREPGLSPWMPAINFDFLFASAGKRKKQAEAARFNADAARLSVFTAAWKVRSDLRRALTEASTASRRETPLRREAEARRALVALLTQRFEAGAIAATDVSLARTSLFRAESAAAEAHAQALQARARVAGAIGIPQSALAGVALPSPDAGGTVSPAALAAARREALRSRPDILIALANYNAARAALELELARRVPDFHLGPGYQWDQGANKWTLGLSFELPLFHRNEAGIAAAAAQVSEAAAQFEFTQGQAVAAVDQAAAAVEAAETQVRHARELRDEARQQLARAHQRFKLGAGDQVELQTAESDLAAAEVAAVDADGVAAAAAGQLEDALQSPLPRLAALAVVKSPPSHE